MVIDVNGPRSSLTVQLPTDLVEEIRALAREKQLSVDDVIREACLAYTEPYFWERSYKEWRKENPHEPLHEFGIDGDDMLPSDRAKD